MQTISRLQAMKQKGEKIACLTAYDALFTYFADQAGLDLLLVGDSMGNTVQGHTDTIPVTLEEMCYHTRCVARGNQNAFLLGDLPFLTYTNPQQTLESSAKIMQSGAQMVKLEGGRWLVETFEILTTRGIPVCAHLGLTPQSVRRLGGYKIQGRDQNSAERIFEDALLLEKAGAQLLVLEGIPKILGKRITEALKIPTIGIGAGPDCDGQVLILHDLLGLIRGKPLTFAKNFLQDSGNILEAFKAYREAVKSGSFPGLEHCFD